MSDAAVPGGQAPTPAAPAQAQDLDAAKPVEASAPQTTDPAADVPAAPDQTQAAAQAVPDQVNDDTPGVDDAEEPTS